MNENIDMCEILKDCPKGTKLYSPLYGEVEFIEIFKENNTFPIRVTSRLGYILFSRNGRRNDRIRCQECMLFPSKEQRDWSKWECHKPKFDPKTLKPFDKVLVSDGVGREWCCDFFSHISFWDSKRIYICVSDSRLMVIPYNNDTKHLVGTSDEAPEYYRYWED